MRVAGESSELRTLLILDLSRGFATCHKKKFGKKRKNSRTKESEVVETWMFSAAFHFAFLFTRKSLNSDAASAHEESQKDADENASQDLIRDDIQMSIPCPKGCMLSFPGKRSAAG